MICECWVSDWTGKTPGNGGNEAGMLFVNNVLQIGIGPQNFQQHPHHPNIRQLDSLEEFLTETDITANIQR